MVTTALLPQDENDRLFDHHCESCNDGFTMFNGKCKAQSGMQWHRICRAQLLAQPSEKGFLIGDQVGCNHNLPANQKISEAAAADLIAA